MTFFLNIKYLAFLNHKWYWNYYALWNNNSYWILKLQHILILNRHQSNLIKAQIFTLVDSAKDPFSIENLPVN